MCNLFSEEELKTKEEDLRSIIVDVILPALRKDSRTQDFADAVIGVEVEQDTVIFKLSRPVQHKRDWLGRSLKGLNVSFQTVAGLSKSN